MLARMDGGETSQSTQLTAAKTMRAEDWATYVVVVILLAAAAYRLELTIGQSESLFGRGIALVERAHADRVLEAAPASQQIFTLALAHEIVTFKATALFLGAIICVLGALFVLRTSQVAYRASFEASGWKLGLGTSSPGLVMITLGCALITVAILARASVESRVPLGAATSSSPQPVSDVAKDVERYDAVLKTAASREAKQTETEHE